RSKQTCFCRTIKSVPKPYPLPDNPYPFFKDPLKPYTMKTYILLTIFFTCFYSITVQSQPKLSSHPAAKATIFIDFDGHFIQGTSWNSGGSFYCKPSGLRDNQIENVFYRVSEDFRPFNVNITTDSTVYLAAPVAQRIRVVVTPTSDWYPGVGGVAFTGSFTWGDDTPAFVFTD